jgi:hypothetical protein
VARLITGILRKHSSSNLEVYRLPDLVKVGAKGTNNIKEIPFVITLWQISLREINRKSQTKLKFLTSNIIF